MPKVSAGIIGKELGLKTEEVNDLLIKIGLLRKCENATQVDSKKFELTAVGKRYGEWSDYFGQIIIWDWEVVAILKEELSV